MSTGLISVNETSDYILLCQQCNKERHRYCCPGCNMRTCSLKCVQQHKVELECSGVRDKTEYVSVSNFTDLNLLNDYRFLEESGRIINVAGRKRAESHQLFSQYRQRNNHLSNAARFRKINLRFLPYSFSKHRHNRTTFFGKNRKLMWQIEWLFPQAENMSLVDYAVDEDHHVSTVLEKYLNPDKCLANISNRLKFYQAAGLRKLRILMIMQSNTRTRYMEIDVDESVRSNLQGQSIIEYPTFIVIPEHDVNMYDIFSSGSDDIKEGMCVTDTENSIEQQPAPKSELISERNHEENRRIPEIWILKSYVSKPYPLTAQ